MRALRSAVVSSALLFILGSASMHPVSGPLAVPSVCADDVRASLVIVEFYPCAVSSDEYLVLCNRAAEAVNLFNWTVTDGEGVIRFTGGALLPGESLSVSENATSYMSVYGEAPGMHLPGWTSGDGAAVSGMFRLADAGDAIEVVSPGGAASDAVVYGDGLPPAAGWTGGPVPGLRQGEVLRRLSYEDALDTDAAGDWTRFQELKYGYTDHGPVSSPVPAGRLTFFTSPDCSLDVVLGALAGATRTIRLCAYELSSASVCACLCEARSGGVDVRVLVDALPAGGMSESEVLCISGLAREGVDVRVVGGNLDEGVVRHFGAMHAKYVVADGERLVTLSENFVEAGVPTDRVFGNRGWGVSVTDLALASFMASVFDDDSRLERPDVWSWRDDPRCDLGAEFPEAGPSAHPEGTLSPVTSTLGAEVSLHVSPDASPVGPFIAPLISASDEVVFEQFQAELEWTTRWSSAPCLSPVIGAVTGVLQAGGSARGLFDGSWYNLEDNGEAVSYLAASALAAGAPPSFGLLTNESPITVMHNKGLVLDGSCVISSNNWVYPSFARNRELAVVVRSEEASSYYLAAFELDWVPDTSAPVADAGPDIVLPAPGEVVLDASGSVDDRAIADVSWDFDGDGWEDASGVSATFAPGSLGTFVIRLVVEDAWGNVASDTVVVTVGPGAEPSKDPSSAVPAVPWALPACLSALAVTVLAARKLNLLRPSTRGKG